ncbi:hypothetical protein ACT1UH_01780 [Mycoplasma sp. 332]|uniref:hypothetical protein n=1 Tax=Mycoplasma sp. 332 TaxID=3458236 RepID=UPI0040359345
MKKLSEKECDEIAGGFAISALITSILGAIPIITSAISSTVGLIRSVNSSKGEIKTKDFNAKWEDTDNNIGFNVGFHYCL